VKPYERYYLRDNPFPATPIIDPSSPDDRINGKIYNPDIMAEAANSFQGKIRRRPPLIYIENSEFVRGVGKSALTARHWRELQHEQGITSIYIRSQEKYKPADFAAHLIERWHQQGNLWTTLLKILSDYVTETQQSAISIDGVEKLAESFPSLPLRPISLASFLVFNPQRLITDLAHWSTQKTANSLPFDLAQSFFESYLTDPAKFQEAYPKVLRKRKWDNITMLATVYRLLNLGGYEFHYLFFDQFEDVVHGLSGKSLITFNTEMRRLIEASLGRATIVVTLHPGATNTLSSDEGGDITSIAPLDQRHVVDVLPLSEKGAGKLAQTYLDHYRLMDLKPPDPFYPFTREAIKLIYSATRGNIRACLQAFNYAIEEGSDADYPLIDKDFLHEHHQDITGRIQAEEVVL
jgi:hypothetical protein